MTDYRLQADPAYMKPGLPKYEEEKQFLEKVAKNLPTLEDFEASDDRQPNTDSA